MTTQTIKLRFSDNEGIQAWDAPGQIDPEEFLAAVKAHPEFLTCSIVGELKGEPIPSDVLQDLICWDREESENVFFLPGMQEDLDDYKKWAAESNFEPDITEPAWFTHVLYEAGWRHEHLAKQNG